MKGKWKLEFSTEERYKASSCARAQTPLFHPERRSLSGPKHERIRRIRFAPHSCGNTEERSRPNYLLAPSRVLLEYVWLPRLRGR